MPSGSAPRATAGAIDSRRPFLSPNPDHARDEDKEHNDCRGQERQAEQRRGEIVHGARLGSGRRRDLAEAAVNDERGQEKKNHRHGGVG